MNVPHLIRRMGGELKVTASFPDKDEIEITQFSTDKDQEAG